MVTLLNMRNVASTITILLMIAGHASAQGSLSGEGQLFGGHVMVWPDGDDSHNYFEINRAQLGLSGEFKKSLYGRVLVETVRSAAPQSAFGVAGNSIVLRLKQASGAVAHDLSIMKFRFEAGLIADPWVQSMESRYDLRAVAPLLAEQTGFFDTADLGAQLSLLFWDDRIRLDATFTNGEGRATIETNPGKTMTGVIRVDALTFDLFEHVAIASFHATGRIGEEGVASARIWRAGAGITLFHPLLSGGFELLLGEGLADREDIKSIAMAAWLNGTLLDGWLGLYARWHTWNMDQDRDEASQSEWGAGAYFDGAQVLDAPFKWRLYAGWASRSYENEAGIAPGVDSAGDTGAFTVMLEVGGQVTHQFDDSSAH